jgi:Uma2 family endonuclease
LCKRHSERRIEYPGVMQATLVPVEEYLRTNYDPDCEYVDGLIVERNLGEKPHSRIQREFILQLSPRAKELGMEVLPEQRVQISATRFRVPAVSVVRESDERIVTSPPFICIEILSKDDTMQYMQEKMDDYLNFGVPYVWIVNPRNRKAYVVTRAGMVEAASGKLETQDPAISMQVSLLFE